VPTEGPVVFVANHIHLVDPPFVMSFSPRRVHPMAKRELFETPLVGWWFWVYGAFPVRRFSGDLGALRVARNYLRNDEVVLMFPEGTRSRDGAGMKPALPGAAMVALLAQVPVVPVAVSGTDSVRLPRVFFSWLWGSRPSLRLEFGEPLELPQQEGPDGTSAEEATDLMMRRIASLLPDRYRGVYGAETEGTIVVRRQARAADGELSEDDGPAEAT
jgi:1-acyl-sn-glycerol-3-phosphate acyltransferase